MKFYTNVSVVGKNVLVREVVDGIPNMRKHDWDPTIFVRETADVKTVYKSLHGEPLREKQIGTIPETRDYIKQFEDVKGHDIYGQLNFSLQYMQEYELSDWDYKYVSSWAIDIETAIPVDENGKTYFPKPEDAPAEVLLITMVDMHSGQAFTWGSKPYPGKDTSYMHCSTEEQLLKMFLEFWEQKRVDIITGWNCAQFDLPYLINRINKVLGEVATKKLSPWGRVSLTSKMFMGKLEHNVNINGVSVLDYLDLYKKYILVKQASYSLGHIASAELGTTKLDHSEFANFTEFYTKAWAKFTEYNIKDTQLVRDLDKKLNLITLVLTMAYEARINYEDTSSPVKLWDALIANYCKDRHIIVPQQDTSEKSGHLDGAYVKEPIPGWYKCVSSIDATSLYPSIIMTNNISPETWIGNCGLTIDDFLDNKAVDVDEKFIVTPAGAIYSRDNRGILPELVEHFMALRKSTKKEMLRLEQVYENTKDAKLPNLIAALDAKQSAIKVAMNSLYGATANEFFRFFKLDHAASITLTGQYVLRTIENKLDDILNKMFGTENTKYVIYIDTDSVYFNLADVVEKYKVPADKMIATIEKLTRDKITPIVNKLCQECCDKMRSYDNKLSFKLEIASDKAIWCGKKKYIVRAHSSEGVTFSKPKFKAKGVEMVRSSTPQFVRDKLRDSLDVIFDSDEKGVQKFIEGVRQEFIKLPVNDIAFPRGANNLLEYADERSIYKKGCPIQVRAVLLYNHFLKERGLADKYPSIGEGDKIKFVYLKKPNKLKENIIGFPVDGVLPAEFGVHGNIDVEEQFDKTFLASMEILIKPIGWNVVETSSLEDFF